MYRVGGWVNNAWVRELSLVSLKGSQIPTDTQTWLHARCQLTSLSSADPGPLREAWLSQGAMLYVVVQIQCAVCTCTCLHRIVHLSTRTGWISFTSRSAVHKYHAVSARPLHAPIGSHKCCILNLHPHACPFCMLFKFVLHAGC